MGTRPSTVLTGFATDATYSSGPHTGEPTKVEPITGEKAQGYHPGKRPPAKKFNWLLNKLFEWIDYLADSAYLNWFNPIFQDLAPSSFNNTHLRRDGTAEAFHAPIHGAGWVLLGKNTAAHFWNGDYDYFQDFNTAVGGAPKMSFGCETNTGRLLLFDHTVNGAGSHTSYLRSDVGALTFTLKNLGNVTTDGAACDVVRVDDALGRIVVCGGQDAKFVVWNSDDAGNTFTKVIVGNRVNVGSNLDRIIVGKDGLLVAWTNDSAINGGNSLWYSEDFGDTWSERATIGFNNILDAVYLPDEDVYLFLLATSLKRTADPIAGSFTTLTGPGTAAYGAIASFGSAVLVSSTPTANIQAMHMSWDRGDTWRQLWRSPVGFTSYTSIFHIGVDAIGGMLAWGPTFARRSMKASRR